MAGYRVRQPEQQHHGQIRNEGTSCLHFDYEALAEATRGFNQRSIAHGGCKLGEGGFGPVFKGDLIFTEVAIKVLRRAPPGNKGATELANEQFEAEIQVLSRFRHPNLVTLLGYSNNMDRPRCLIYEFMPNGTLEDTLEIGVETRKMGKDTKIGLPWMVRVSIALDTARGLTFLHSAIKNTPLVHRDVKSANVLLDLSFRAKVGDFGLVRAIGHDPHTHIKQSVTARIVGTSGYIAPEYFRGKITIKLDTYAFGVLLLEVLTGLPSYDQTRGPERAELVSHVEVVERKPAFTVFELIDARAGNWPSESFGQLFSTAKKCLDPNFETRPEMSEIYRRLDLLSKFSYKEFADEEIYRERKIERKKMKEGSTGTHSSMNIPNQYCDDRPKLPHSAIK